MTNIELLPWRLVIDGCAGEVERSLAAVVGSDRACEVRLDHDLDGVVVTLTTDERDALWLVWEVVSDLARFWPALDAFVGLTVRLDDLTVRTSASVMEAVAGGCRHAVWRAAITTSIDV
jgi:hypothetical protein